jgi:hypothetical protein
LEYGRRSNATAFLLMVTGPAENNNMQEILLAKN